MTELSIRPEEIRDALQRFVSDYQPEASSKEEVGTVAEAGDGIARVAGIQGAKRTSELIPLCHPLPLDAVSIESTRNEMWLTQAGLFGEGSAASSSPRSKKAMNEPSCRRKKKCVYGQYSPVLGTWSLWMMWYSGRPRMSS